jgi:hypothetical protein
MVGKRLGGNEHGFSLIEASLVFVVIVLLATAAGLVADRQTDSSSGQLKPNTIQLGTQPSPQSSTPTTTTLELSALGIEITVPNAINDLTYAAPTAGGGYGISTQTLTTDDARCVATGNAPPLGDFYKGAGKYSGTAGASSRLAKQFAEFYIAWAPPQTACSTSSTVTSLANQQVQALVAAFDTIEELPAGS